MFKRIAVSACIAASLVLSACQAEDDNLSAPESADNGNGGRGFPQSGRFSRSLAS